MRALVVATLIASTSLATPAMARDGSWYVGIEGGILQLQDPTFDFRDGQMEVDEAIVVDGERGFDVDAIAGYDFGMFRVEGEIAYKRAKFDELRLASELAGSNPQPSYEVLNGRNTALSGMINALVDFSDDSGWSGYAGGGLGYARVKDRFDVADSSQFLRGTDSGLAWQGIAGIRYAFSPTMEAGLKYRFFNVPNVEYDVDEGPGGAFEVERRWRSHSLLASLIFNMAPPPPPPPPPPVVAAPPPPPPPATQVCPDGSVILATDVCPAPPPPPPPPPPMPERG